ncbi:hypothetical protein TNCV_2411271 [Trichonephila clavipes]|nr:hypothetical protein TNCV_2411271 [Trichonephila clavipes]
MLMTISLHEKALNYACLNGGPFHAHFVFSPHLKILILSSGGLQQQCPYRSPINSCEGSKPSRWCGTLESKVLAQMSTQNFWRNNTEVSRSTIRMAADFTHHPFYVSKKDFSSNPVTKDISDSRREKRCKSSTKMANL